MLFSTVTGAEHNQSIYSQKTLHILPSGASYGVYIVRIWEKITAPRCIRSSPLKNFTLYPICSVVVCPIPFMPHNTSKLLIKTRLCDGDETTPTKLVSPSSNIIVFRPFYIHCCHSVSFMITYRRVQEPFVFKLRMLSLMFAPSPLIITILSWCICRWITSSPLVCFVIP